MWVDVSRAVQWHLAGAAWLIRRESLLLPWVSAAAPAPRSRAAQHLSPDFGNPRGQLVSGLGSLRSRKEGIWKEGAAVMRETLVL